MQAPIQPLASVWLRALAFAIDFIVIRFFLYWVDKIYLSMGVLLFKEQHINLVADNGIFALGVWGLMILHFMVWIGYFVIFECYRFRATPGKIIVKACIVCADGAPINFSITFLRNVYKLLPIALFQCIGIEAVVVKHSEYINSRDFLEHAQIDIQSQLEFKAVVGMAVLFIVISYSLMLFTKHRQTLHDLMAKTLVVKSDENILKELYLRSIAFIKHLRKTSFLDS